MDQFPDVTYALARYGSTDVRPYDRGGYLPPGRPAIVSARVTVENVRHVGFDAVPTGELEEFLAVSQYCGYLPA